MSYIKSYLGYLLKIVKNDEAIRPHHPAIFHRFTDYFASLGNVFM